MSVNVMVSTNRECTRIQPLFEQESGIINRTNFLGDQLWMAIYIWTCKSQLKSFCTVSHNKIAIQVKHFKVQRGHNPCDYLLMLLNLTVLQY